MVRLEKQGIEAEWIGKEFTQSLAMNGILRKSAAAGLPTPLRNLLLTGGAVR